MSVYETSITNPKKQLKFYKQLSEQLQQGNKQLKYLEEKYMTRLNLIEKYLSRIETETTKDKNALTYKDEKKQNKDSIIELDFFLKDLGE